MAGHANGLWQQAGRVGNLICAGHWWSVIPSEQLPDDPEFQAELNEISVEPFGDRRQELGVIGHELNESEFSRQLDACLLTDEEFEAGPDAWAKFDDPVPEWELLEHDHDHHHGHDHGHHH